MNRILSRMLTRLAIVVASLAWGGFVFTQTIGDPGRGERIAAAVLDDDAARAEVVAPITASVMRSSGLPTEQRPIVEQQVDLLLQDPGNARAFIDPFAGSWARMLGEDDPRPASLDATSLIDDIAASIGAAAPAAAALPVTDVPLPRVELGWMGDVRRGIDAVVLPLALLAAALFAVAFVIGERPRVLRRFGVWAIGAGLLWVIVPPGLVWAAQRWAPGADSVVAAALDEATSGLLGVALTLVLGGVAAFGGSLAVAGAEARAPADGRGARRHVDNQAVAPARATPRGWTAAQQHTRTMPATAKAVTRTMPAVPPAAAGTGGAADLDATSPLPRTQRTMPDDAGPDDDGDALWDYYSS